MCGWANGPIYCLRPEMDLPLITAWSLHHYTGQTITVSPLYSTLALESLLESPLGSMLDSLLGSLLEKATLEKATLWE